jgi:hypothetical protein
VVRHGDGQHGGIRRPEREQRDAEICRDDHVFFASGMVYGGFV